MPRDSHELTNGGVGVHFHMLCSPIHDAGLLHEPTLIVLQ